MTRAELFTQFIDQHPNWEQQAGVFEQDSSTYKRIRLGRHDSTINVKTGEIFNADPRWVILVKHILLLAVGRPLHLCGKFVWHATVIGPLVQEGYKLYTGKITKEQFKENMHNSFRDIVRTPVYGIAMLAVHLAGIFAAVYPNSLYYTRDLVGQLDRALLRIEIIDQDCKPPCLPYESVSPCFSPIKHFMRILNLPEEYQGISRAINEFLEKSDSFKLNSWDYKSKNQQPVNRPLMRDEIIV